MRLTILPWAKQGWRYMCLHVRMDLVKKDEKVHLFTPPALQRIYAKCTGSNLKMHRLHVRKESLS
jgi:hypothetical protein